jgi:hypothetical protein
LVPRRVIELLIFGGRGTAGGARWARRGAEWLVEHNYNINRRPQRIAHLGAHQPSAIG